MGCTGSKHTDDVAEPTLDFILANKDNPDGHTSKETSNQPDNKKQNTKLLKDIEKYYKIYCEKKDSLKPLISERTGLQTILNEEKERLVNLLSKKESLFKDRERLIDINCDMDVMEIYKAFGKFSIDKSILIGIFINRTRYMIDIIAKKYESKYGRPLLELVINDMTTMLGTLATGGNTGLSKLLTYRIMSQPDRDAGLLRDCSGGLGGLNDDTLIEIVMTRTNNELKLAMDNYFDSFKMDLADIVRTKASYNNYKSFMLKVLELERDEEKMNQPLDDDTASKYAKELYDAGKGNLIGIEPEPFIRILSVISPVQFQSINRKYKDQKLLDDISSKIGGAFEMAIVARCTDKYEFLATKITKAFKSSFSIDREAVCRIFGSLKRSECRKLREAYDRLNLATKTSLDKTIKNNITKGNFQKALLDLILSDPSETPLGTDNEPDDDEKEMKIEGEIAKTQSKSTYNNERLTQRGSDVIIQRKRNSKTSKHNDDSDNDGNDNGNSTGKGGEVVTMETILLEELDDEIPKYTFDSIRARFMDTNKLNKELTLCQQATKDILVFRERMVDEINALKEIYFSLIATCMEAEVAIRIFNNHIKCLKTFIDQREKTIAASTKKK